MFFLPCFDFPLGSDNTGSIFLIAIVKGEPIDQTAISIIRSLILDDISNDSSLIVIV